MCDEIINYFWFVQSGIFQLENRMRGGSGRKGRQLSTSIHLFEIESCVIQND